MASSRATAEIAEPPTASTRRNGPSWVRRRSLAPATDPSMLPIAPATSMVPSTRATAVAGEPASWATRGARATPTTTPTMRPAMPMTCSTAPRRYPEYRDPREQGEQQHVEPGHVPRIVARVGLRTGAPAHH